MTDESSQPEAAAEAGHAGEVGPAPATGDPTPATGDPRVDEALEALAGLDEVPGTEHVQAFERVHRQLHEILDEIAEQEKPSGSPGPDRR